MTKLGKIFVFIQFVLSIVMLVTALMTFVFHIRGRAKNENYYQPEIKRYQEQINRLAESRDRAEARWTNATQRMVYLEQFRPQAQDWYAKKLHLTITGLDPTGKPVDDPVRELEYQQQDPANIETRQLVYNPTLLGPTIIEHRKGTATAFKVPSYNALQQSLRTKQNVIQQQQKEIEKAMAEYVALSEQLRGDDRMVKGLYREKILMDEERKRLIAEQERLKPILANRYSETVLVLKRQNSLLERKQELEKVGVAASSRP